MENSLAKYLGKEYKNIITSVTVSQGTAKDSGNLYYYIDMSFVNGYKKKLFLRQDELFAWTNAMDSLEAQKIIEKEFAD